MESHLRAALRGADDGTARYHLREALQLRVTETANVDDHT
jgi:hypothetical protein